MLVATDRLANLTAQIGAVAPIAGVSIGRWDDKATWRIDFAPEATAEQRGAAAVTLGAFDPDAVPPNYVKVEARRRILLRFPEWKQANMTARGVELTLVLASGGQWSPQEQAEADALQGAWDWIKQVRVASDALEAASPIPTDYTADSHWPV